MVEKVPLNSQQVWFDIKGLRSTMGSYVHKQKIVCYTQCRYHVTCGKNFLSAPIDSLNNIVNYSTVTNRLLKILQKGSKSSPLHKGHCLHVVPNLACHNSSPNQ